MKTLQTVVAISVMCAGAAVATTVVEGFESISVGQLGGQGSAGGGWAGAWGSVPGGFNTHNVEATRAADSLTGANTANQRSLTTPISVTSGAPDIWLSFDLRIDFTATTQNSSDFIQLFGPAGANNAPNIGGFGRQNDPSGNRDYSAFTTGGGYNNVVNGGQADIPDDVWTHVAVKIVPTGTGAATYSLWADPNYLLSETDGSQVTPRIAGGTISEGPSTIDGLAIFSQTLIKHRTFYDNIRLSDESSLFVPEPGTFTLLVLGSLSLSLLRRRRS